MEIDNCRCVFLDTETTGKCEDGPAHIGHRVIDIGAVEVINRRFTDNNFQCYLNPHRQVDPEAVQVHGITDEFLQDKPDFKDLAQKFIDYIRGAVLIIHNAKFDVGFLDQEFELCGLKERIADLCTVVDSYSEAKELLPGHAKYSLDALSKMFNLQHNYDRSFHGALLDSKILADVYLAMTGGQNTMDGMLKNMMHDVDSDDAKSAEICPPGTLAVLRANKKELAAHAKKLSGLNKTHTSNWEKYYYTE